MIPVIQREVSKSGTQAFFARTLEQHVGFSVLPARLAVNISGWFGFLAVFLAMIGIYGAAGFSVIQRTREIGIRMALGAKPADVMRQTILKGMFPVGTGLIIGWISAAILARLASEFLYGLSGTDSRTYFITTILFCATALLAIYLPARRAVRIDPMTALRYE